MKYIRLSGQRSRAVARSTIYASNQILIEAQQYFFHVNFCLICNFTKAILIMQFNLFQNYGPYSPTVVESRR